MRKRCFIHVGTHKTATTTIQHFLAGNDHKLESAGFHIPKTGRIYPQSGHHNLAWELNNDPRFKPSSGTFQDLAQELENSNTANIVLSSEDFEYLYNQPDKKRFLRDFFSALGFDIHIVVFLRNQVDYANSLFGTLVQFHSTMPFKQYARLILDNKCYESRYDLADGSHCTWRYCFDYQDFLASWSSDFDNIICRSFEQEMAAGRAEDRFLACLGIETGTLREQGLEYFPVEEKSLGQTAIERILIFNQLAERLEVDTAGKIASAKHFMEKYRKAAVRDRPYNGFDVPIRENLCHLFSTGNEWVRDQYGIAIPLRSAGESSDSPGEVCISQDFINELADALNIVLKS